MGHPFEGSLPAAVLEWAMRTSGSPGIECITVEPMRGGAVSSQVELITLHLTPVTAGSRKLAVVRKRASTHEINGLRAAQAVRPAAVAIPELIAYGFDGIGPWLISAMCPGKPLRDRSDAIPVALFDSLARLHARYRDTAGAIAVPQIDLEWWRDLCLRWVLPRAGQFALRHSARVGAHEQPR